MSGAWEIHHGNAIEHMTALPDASIDHVITDPPYSEHVHANVRSRLIRSNDSAYGGRRNAIAKTRRVQDLGFTHLTAETMTATSQQIARLTRRWTLVFCDSESAHLWRAALETAGLDYVRTGIWLKPGAAPQFSGDRPGVGYESIVIAHQPGRKRWNGGGKHAIWSEPIVLNRDGRTPRVHSAQKPVGLMASLITDFTDRGDVVLDPFAGSGSTGVAAVTIGRRFIGVELDAAHYATAVARVEAAVAQPRLIGAA